MERREIIWKSFGFQYESIGSIILFLVIATIMSFLLNLIVEALPKALYELKWINKQHTLILYLVLDTIATSVGLKMVDYFMSSVLATTISIVAISFLLALPDIDDFKSKYEDKLILI